MSQPLEKPGVRQALPRNEWGMQPEGYSFSFFLSFFKLKREPNIYLQVSKARGERKVEQKVIFILLQKEVLNRHEVLKI